MKGYRLAALLHYMDVGILTILAFEISGLVRDGVDCAMVPAPEHARENCGGR